MVGRGCGWFSHGVRGGAMSLAPEARLKVAGGKRSAPTGGRSALVAPRSGRMKAGECFMRPAGTHPRSGCGPVGAVCPLGKPSHRLPSLAPLGPGWLARVEARRIFRNQPDFDGDQSPAESSDEPPHSRAGRAFTRVPPRGGRRGGVPAAVPRERPGAELRTRQS